MSIRRSFSPAALGAALLVASAAIAQDGAEPTVYERTPPRAEVFLRGRAGSEKIDITATRAQFDALIRRIARESGGQYSFVETRSMP